MWLILVHDEEKFFFLFLLYLSVQVYQKIQNQRRDLFLLRNFVEVEE